MRTRVGYAGGTKVNPTYRSLGDHTESFQVDFDPAKITYERLLEVFWAVHDPTAGAWSRQYANILFVADAGQEKAARESLGRVAARLGTEVTTGIRTLDRFWPAEDYHQKYALRGDRTLLAPVLRLFPDATDFRESPVAAKMNALAAGDLAFPAMKAQLAALGWEVVGDGRIEEIRALPAVAAATK